MSLNFKTFLIFEKVTLHTILSRRYYEINFNQSHVILDGLNQRTEYHINVSFLIFLVFSYMQALTMLKNKNKEGMMTCIFHI